MPGVTSALGLLQVDLALRSQRSVLLPLSDVDPAHLSRAFAEMEKDLSDRFMRSGHEDVAMHRYVDVRYFGQSRYLTVSAPNGAWADESTTAVVNAFHQEHEREHGYVMPSEVTQIEISNLRVAGEVAVPRVHPSFNPSGRPRFGRRTTHFRGIGFAEVQVFERPTLPSGFIVDGPAIIEQIDSTIVLPPESHATVLRHGEIMIEV
jgi:N-methylhydantoinase A